MRDYIKFLVSTQQIWSIVPLASTINSNINLKNINISPKKEIITNKGTTS